MKKFPCIALLAFCGGSLFAQSEADSILRQTKNMPSQAADVVHVVTQTTPAGAPAGPPPVQNILTVIGDNNNTGSPIPCFFCISGANGSNIGIVQPDGTVHADGATAYAVNNYMVDNSYNGDCNFTFLVRDAAQKFIAKTGPFTFTEPSGSSSLTSTTITIPHSPTVAGEGEVLMLLQCGSTSAVSASAVYIAYP